MARRTRPSRWASQAAQEALVRYGPELSGLVALQRQAETDYRTGLAQAAGNARGTISTIDAAIPNVRNIYENAGLTQARTASTFTGDAGKIDPNSPLAAAASLEQQVGIRHLNEAESSALTGLQNQRVAARSGQTFASGKARTDFINAIGQILQRRQDLAREQGAFIGSTAQQLQQADLNRQQSLDIANARLNQSERDSLRSAGIDPNTGKPIPNGRLDPKRKGGGGGATGLQIGAAQDTVQGALSWARRLKGAGLARADVAAALSSGRPSAPIYTTDATGKRVPALNKDGTPKTRSAIPATKSQLLLSAALDVVYTGYVSKQTARKIHDRGLTLRDLGLPSAADLRRKARGGSYESGVRAGTLAGPPA